MTKFIGKRIEIHAGCTGLQYFGMEWREIVDPIDSKKKIYHLIWMK